MWIFFPSCGFSNCFSWLFPTWLCHAVFRSYPLKKNRFVAQTVNLGRNLKSFEQAPHLRNHTVTSCCSSVVPFTSSQPSISPCAKNATGSEMRQLWVTYSPSSIASFYLSRSFFLNIGKTVMIPSRLLHKNIACFVCQKITWGKMVFKHLWTKQGFRGFPVGFQYFHPKSWDFLTAGPSNAELLILHCVIHQKGEVLTSESRDAQGTRAAVSALWLHRWQNRKEMARKSSRARAWRFKRLKKKHLCHLSATCHCHHSPPVLNVGHEPDRTRTRPTGPKSCEKSHESRACPAPQSSSTTWRIRLGHTYRCAPLPDCGVGFGDLDL